MSLRTRVMLALLAVCVVGMTACTAGTEETGSLATAVPLGDSKSSPARADFAACDTTGLPFALTGKTCEHVTVDVPQDSPALQTTPAWSFGGDFRFIASALVSSSTAFGSTTDTPDDLRSYSPGLIHSDGRVDQIGGVDLDNGTYYEPQDGTVSSKWLVWRLGTLNGSGETDSAVDEWKIVAMERSTAATRVVAKAGTTVPEGRRDAVVSEAVPSASDSFAYFATASLADEHLEHLVLRVPLDESEASASAPQRIAGTAVAATRTGALLIEEDAVSEQPTTLSYLDERDEVLTPYMEIDPGAEGWHWAGVWSSGTAHAVLATPADSSESWIGVFDDAGDSPWTWYHSPTPVAVVSITDGFLAWGSGSMGGIDDGWMYLVDRVSSSSMTLGRAPGYARPSLAPDGSAILVPRSDGISPARWDVIPLR